MDQFTYATTMCSYICLAQSQLCTFHEARWWLMFAKNITQLVSAAVPAIGISSGRTSHTTTCTCAHKLFINTIRSAFIAHSSPWRQMRASAARFSVDEGLLSPTVYIIDSDTIAPLLVSLGSNKCCHHCRPYWRAAHRFRNAIEWNVYRSNKQSDESPWFGRLPAATHCWCLDRIPILIAWRMCFEFWQMMRPYASYNI